NNNRKARIKPVKVDKELFDITKRALFFSKLTNESFDISFAAMDKIWRFSDSIQDHPSQETFLNALEYVCYHLNELNKTESSIFLKLPGMKIGFRATGKGYAADRGKHIMQQLQVKSGIVNASGDMATWGVQPNNKPWRIGIANPFNPYKSLQILGVNTAAMTTSGDYQKYVEFNDKRYSH